MTISDLAYWIFTVPLKFMQIPMTICGYTFSFWDLFIFAGLVAIFGVLVSVLYE